MQTITRLSTEQVSKFKRDGFVIVRGLIEPEVLENWRGQFANRWGPLEERSTWTRIREECGVKRHTTVPRDFQFEPESARLSRHPSVAAIIKQSGGGEFFGDDSNPHIVWPQPDIEWQVPENAHIDGYADNEWWPFVMGANTYLFDVKSTGGATILWPGSHVAVWRYFQENPDHIDGSWQENKVEFKRRFKGDAEPFEAVMEAGDVLFWHYWLVHTPSPNASDRPRWGLFSRYHHKRQEAVKGEVPEDLWKHWGI